MNRINGRIWNRDLYTDIATSLIIGLMAGLGVFFGTANTGLALAIGFTVGGVVLPLFRIATILVYIAKKSVE